MLSFYIRIGEKCDLCDSDIGSDWGSRWAGLNVLKTSDLQGLLHTNRMAQKKKKPFLLVREVSGNWPYFMFELTREGYSNLLAL